MPTWRGHAGDPLSKFIVGRDLMGQHQHHAEGIEEDRRAEELQVLQEGK